MEWEFFFKGGEEGLKVCQPGKFPALGSFAVVPLEVIPFFSAICEQYRTTTLLSRSACKPRVRN